jgi:P4 family phage/plasmid primase-like protien
MTDKKEDLKTDNLVKKLQSGKFELKEKRPDFKSCANCDPQQQELCKAEPVRKLICMGEEYRSDVQARYAEPISKYPKSVGHLFHKDRDKQNGHLIIKELGDAIIRLDRFLHFRDSEDVLRFNGSIYEEFGEQYIKEVTNRLLGEEYTIQRANEVIGYIKTLSDDQVQHITRHTDVETPLILIPFKNGVYNIITKTLGPYDYCVPFFNQLPVNFDPNADCPRFKQFLDEVADPGDHAVIQEWMGYCLYRAYPFAKALLLVGRGRNGKTVLLKVINTMVGPENTSHISLQQLTTNRFAIANLYNKYVNNFADLPDKAVVDTGNFKTLVGNDPVTAEKKNKPFFNFINYAKFGFSCNKVPESYDETDAYYARWIIVTFPNQFLGDKDDKELLNKLVEELPGIVNFALAGLHRLLQRQDFSYNKSLEETRKFYKRSSSTVHAFVEDCLEVDSEGAITKEGLYSAYATYCKANKIVALFRDVFHRKLPHEAEWIASGRSKEPGRPYVWRGLKYKEGMEPTLTSVETTLEMSLSDQSNQSNHISKPPPSSESREEGVGKDVRQVRQARQVEKMTKTVLSCPCGGFLKGDVKDSETQGTVFCEKCTRVQTIKKDSDGSWVIVEDHNEGGHSEPGQNVTDVTRKMETTQEKTRIVDGRAFPICDRYQSRDGENRVIMTSCRRCGDRRIYILAPDVRVELCQCARGGHDGLREDFFIERIPAKEGGS